MNRHRPARLVLATAWALGLIGSAGLGQDDRDRQAKQVVFQLASLRAMVKFVQSDAVYGLPQDQLAAFITGNLQTQRKNTEAAARGAVGAGADAMFRQRVESVAREIDPTDKYGVLPWLKDRMRKKSAGQEKSLRREFDDRIAADLSDEGSRLRVAYRQARKRAADAQVKNALERIKNDTTGIAPTEQDITAATQDEKAKSALVSRTVEALAGMEINQVLEEAEGELTGKAAGLVEQGVSQYRKFLQDVRGLATKAYTRQGIHEEVIDAGRIAQQRASANQAAAGRVYDFFKHDQAWGEPETARRFELKVAEVIKAVSSSIPGDVRERIAGAISGNSLAHHTISKSFEIFRKEAGKRARKQTLSDYTTKAENARSSYDTEERRGKLPTEIGQALDDAKARCRPDWDALIKRSEESLRSELGRIRAELAQEDARRRCPKLMSGDWWPSGPEILSNPLSRFSRRKLREGPLATILWKLTPPAETEMIEETWQLIEKRARHRLEIGHRALAGQQACVRGLRDEILRQMQTDKSRSASEWYEEYARAVLTQWRRRSGDEPEAVAAYPELLEEVLTQIRGIVEEALRLEIAKGVAAKATTGDTGTGKPESATRPVGEGQEKPRTPPEAERLRMVEARQNEIVDQVRPEVSQRAQERIRAGEQPALEETCRHFTQLVEQRWLRKWPELADVLKPEDKEILPSVRERIRGIVAQMLQISAGRDARIRHAQSRLVKAHEPGIREMVLEDRKAAKMVAARSKDYRLEYEKRVRESWQKDKLSETPGYGSLLPGTLNEIRGAVASLIEEIAGPDAPEEVTGKDATSQPASRPAAGAPKKEEAGGGAPGPASGPADGPGGGGDRPGGTQKRPGIVGGPGDLAVGRPGRGSGEGMEYRPFPTGEAARPTAGGGWFARGASVVLLVLALLMQAVFLWAHFRGRRQRQQILPTFARRFDGRDRDAVASAIVRQMDVALQCLEAYRPSRRVETLNDLYASGQELLEQVRARWNATEASRILPNLEIETQQLAFGGVLVVAGLDDAPDPAGD